ncbi:MAG: penicillin-binding protein 2 [Bdellovibrionaceae bacterium]|nr:penicillin-binding protein 2 [Pseudobdellovibrionaceae bacterium]
MSKYISNTDSEAKEYRGRFKFLYFCVMLASFTILTRLWYLQIIQGHELRDYSEKNRVKETKIDAPRGFFLDRNGEILVQNLPGFSVTISPQYSTKLEETAKAVSEVLNIPADSIIKSVKVSKYKNGPFRPVPIKENLDLTEVFKLKLIRMNHPGLNIQQNILRNYPLKENGAQLFGYVGEISKNQIQLLNTKFSDTQFEQGDIIGKSGLEEVWERKVHGEPGITFVEVDARGREATTDTPSFLGLKAYKAKPGNNLVLTIDKDIQIAAYQAMQRDDKIGPRIGSLVAIKNNGEILAWVNSPSFDPNEFSKGISNEIWEKLINDPFKPLRNKIIQDHYAPGSTFKPLIALAALQEKVITPSTIVFAPGFIKFGRRLYHDHSKQGHGNINVIQAIERSSNVFFYKMGISLGIDKMFQYASAFGIGNKTEINLFNEVPGLMPNSEWKKRQYGEEWQPGENLSNAIGQGFVLTTPLQMALAFNAIGTDGKLFKPFIVKKIMDHKENMISEYSPHLVRDISLPDENGFFIDKKNFKVVKEGMRLVVNGERGTARWYQIPGVEIAGKTGTAQVRSFSAEQIYDKCHERPIEERHHGWFVGFAPADYPEITVAVLAEHACAGSSGGAPIVKDVIKAYFEKYHPEKLKEKKKKT